MTGQFKWLASVSINCCRSRPSGRSTITVQMEKRGERVGGESDKYPRCRLVLQRALTHNLQNLPGAAQLCQAWGLLEVWRRTRSYRHHRRC